MNDQHAPPRRAAMLHARHHFLTDIAALAERQSARLVEIDVMRKGVTKGIIAARFGHACADPETGPFSGAVRHSIRLCRLAPNRFGKTPVADLR